MSKKNSKKKQVETKIVGTIITPEEKGRIATLWNNFGILQEASKERLEENQRMTARIDIERGKIDKVVKDLKKIRKYIFKNTSGATTPVSTQVILRRMELLEADIDCINDSMKLYTETVEDDIGDVDDTEEIADAVIVKKPITEKYDLSSLVNPKGISSVGKK